MSRFIVPQVSEPDQTVEVTLTVDGDDPTINFNGIAVVFIDNDGWFRPLTLSCAHQGQLEKAGVELEDEHVKWVD